MSANTETTVDMNLIDDSETECGTEADSNLERDGVQNRSGSSERELSTMSSSGPEYSSSTTEASTSRNNKQSSLGTVASTQNLQDYETTRSELRSTPNIECKF